MATLTALQKLAAYLDPSPSIAGVDEQNAARTGQRGVDREAFLKAAEKSGDERDKIIRRLAETYASEAGLEALEIGNAVNEFAERATPDFETQEQPENPQLPAQEGGFLTGLAKVVTDRKESTIAGRAKDEATFAVHSLQEEELLKQFNDALEQGAQSKIAELLSNADTSKLFEQQLKYAHDHLDLLNPDELRLARLDGNAKNQKGEDILGEDGKPISKVQNMHNEFDAQARKQAAARAKRLENLTPAQKDAHDKRLAEEARLHAIATDVGRDKKDRRNAFHGLLKSRQSQILPYSIFAEYYDENLDGMLVPLSQLIGNQERANLRKKQGQRQHMQHAVNQQANMQTNAANALQKARGQKDIKGQAKKAIGQAIGTAAKAAGPEFEALWWGARHWKLILTVVLIFLIVFISVIIALFSFLFPQGQPQQQPTGTGVHPKYPAVPDNFDYAKDIRDKFGISMIGYDSTHLKWAWQKFYNISDTKFISLVQGKIFIQSVFSGSHVFCVAGHCQAFVAQYVNTGTFDAILLHEIGHIIQWTQPSSVNHQTELPGIIRQEGYLTLYSQRNCLHTNQFFEDFAETLAYYLNYGDPTVGMTTGCGHGPNPYEGGAHPLHYNFAREILGPY